MTNPVPLSQPCPNPVPGHGAQPCPPVPLSRGDRGQGQPKHPRPTNPASTLSLLFDTARWHHHLDRHEGPKPAGGGSEPPGAPGILSLDLLGWVRMDLACNR